MTIVNVFLSVNKIVLTLLGEYFPATVTAKFQRGHRLLGRHRDGYRRFRLAVFDPHLAISPEAVQDRDIVIQWYTSRNSYMRSIEWRHFQ